MRINEIIKYFMFAPFYDIRRISKGKCDSGRVYFTGGRLQVAGYMWQVTCGMLHVSGDRLEDAGQKLQVKLNSLFRQITTSLFW